MTKLEDEGCVPCRGGERPMAADEQQSMLRALSEWTITTDHDVPRLVREFRFNNFTGAIRFAVAVGRIAEEQDHHPELTVAWGRVAVAWWTHAVGGLHRNDFIMAAKTDAIYADEGGASG
jgi:4a-hydroxytetrahydrobiopterin dehydratase